MRPELERRLAVLVEPLERAVLDGVRELEAEPDRVRVGLGLVLVFSDERPLTGLAGLLDWRSGGRLSAIVRSSFFTGGFGERLLTPGERRWPVDRLVLLGAGPRGEFDDARARELGRRCVEIATGLAANSVLIALPTGPIERGVLEIAFDAVLEAIERRATAPGRPTEPEPIVVEPAPPPEPTEVGEPQPSEPLADGLEPAAAPEPEPSLVESPAEPETPDEPEEPAIRELEVWVVADEGVVARLRRVRNGPPRPARSGPSLYT